MTTQRPLLIVLASLSLGLPSAHGETSILADEKILKAAQLPTDGPGLLEYLRKQTGPQGGEQRIQALIRLLGDRSFRVREKASAELVTFKSKARPFLLQAVNDPDVEIGRRARACLASINADGGSADVSMVRVLAARNPQGTLAALLAYLPAARSDQVVDEVEAALGTLSRPGKPDPALLAALAGKDPLARAVAAVVLYRSYPDQRPAALKVLKDGDVQACFRAARGLAEAGAREAVPVLIDMLTLLPADQAWKAEEMLFRLTDLQVPSVVLAKGKADREKCRAAWTGWWKKHAAKADLTLLAPPKQSGNILLTMLDSGDLLEIDAAGKTLWQINGLDKALDVQVLPKDRVLVAEYQGKRVTERDLKGRVLWEYKGLTDGPLSAQRLKNGNTFIATQYRLLEVDPEGKEVFTYSKIGDTFRKAAKLPNGDIAFVTMSRSFIRLSPDKKELCSFTTEIHANGGRLDVQPNGNVLVPQMDYNQVVEYDTLGKKVWEYRMDEPIAAIRLSSGNTLITSLTAAPVEVDAGGKKVWEYSKKRVNRAWRR